jgi:hypothetical protein
MASMKPIIDKMSLNNSQMRVSKSITLRPLESETREVVSDMIDKMIGSDWRASHRFDLKKDGRYLETNEYYVYKRQGRERPGLLLVYSSENPAVYWDMDKDEPSSIRLQIPFGFLKNGPSLYSVTLLKGEGILLMEDIWMSYGKNIKNISFSERWCELLEHFKELSVQQLFLGFTFKMIEPISLEEFISSEPDPGSIWDFQPEQGNHKRLYWMCPGVKLDKSKGSQLREREKTSLLKLPPSVNKNVLKRSSDIISTRCARVKAHPSGFPDIYILESAENKNIGNACITKLQQSIDIKDAISKSDNKTINAEVAWHTGFNKYEIIRILPNDIPLSSITVFHEISK